MAFTSSSIGLGQRVIGLERAAGTKATGAVAPSFISINKLRPRVIRVARSDRSLLEVGLRLCLCGRSHGVEKTNHGHDPIWISEVPKATVRDPNSGDVLGVTCPLQVRRRVRIRSLVGAALG